MRFRKFLVEEKQKFITKSEIQKIVDDIVKKEKIEPIKIKFSDKMFSKGPAYYQTSKINKMNRPEFIKIGGWSSIKKHPDEIANVLSHELSHHILNIKENSLRHGKKFNKKWKEINLYINKKLNGKNEKDRIKKKIEYWQKHRNEIEQEQKEINKSFDFDREIENMKSKMKKI